MKGRRQRYRLVVDLNSFNGLETGREKYSSTTYYYCYVNDKVRHLRCSLSGRRQKLKIIKTTDGLTVRISSKDLCIINNLLTNFLTLSPYFNPKPGLLRPHFRVEMTIHNQYYWGYIYLLLSSTERLSK